MSQADIVYNKVIQDILDHGKWDTGGNVRTKWKDGATAYTKSILDAQMKFDNSKEVAIYTSKRVPQKDPLNEGFWIWRDKSNNVEQLREMGCTVWDEWEREDGTIGKSYGWQLRNKKRKVEITPELDKMYINKELNDVVFSNFSNHAFLDQVDYLIYTLKTNPYSRRIKTTLWCVEDLDDMALEPCVYETHWQMWDDKLNLTVCVRSNDMGLGNPYNVYQYSIIHRLIAQVTGHQVGSICFNIDNAHIYDRHIDKLEEQITRETFNSPTVWINPEIQSFYDFTIDDIKLENYQCGKGIKLEVAL